MKNIFSLKRVLKICFRAIVIILILVVTLGLVLNLSPVQTFIAKKVTKYLSERLETTVSVEKVHFHFFDKLELEQLIIIDHYRDTLLASGSLTVDLNNLFFLKNEIIIQDVQLSKGNVFLKRHSDTDQWNYQFIIDKLIPKDTSQSTIQSSLALQLEKFELKDTRFAYIDEWVGTDYIAHIGSLSLLGKGIDYEKKSIHIANFTFENGYLGLKEYTGGRPYKKKKVRDVNEFAGTPFNKSDWNITVDQLQINDGRFYLEHPETEAPMNFFDERHLDIKSIATNIKDISIIGDTIKGNVLHLEAKERSGLTIKKFTSKVTVSPNLAECKDLLLQTNNSTVKDYYAMHYRHFPDFLDYINKVKMVGHFKDASVGINDILYFTNTIERLKDRSFRLTGLANGPVSDLKSELMTLTDGQATYVGDFAIKDIPHTDVMTVQVNSATIVGNADKMMTYIPELVRHPNVNIPSVGNFIVKGSFNGRMDDFKASMQLNSSVGKLSSNLHFRNAMSGIPQYDGVIHTENLDLGSLINEKDWRNLTTTVQLKGTGVSPSEADFIDFDIVIPEVTFRNYTYHNATILGLYRDNVFKGSASVKDTNCNVLIENGQLYFTNKQANYNLDATIHYVNTKALHFTDHDLSGKAEVNLHFTGNTLDDFLGSVFVYNMEMKVADEPINLSQFYLSSTVSQGKKTLNFLTNGIDASLNGDFKISTLHLALNQYFHQYFPDYFKNEERYTEEQDLKFYLSTKQTDDFFKLINVKAQLDAGVELRGQFNSSHDHLSFEGDIPYGNINDINFKDAKIKVWGDEDGLKQDISLNNFSYQNYEIASAVQLDANLMNNFVDFVIKTESINTLGNAEITGNLLGRNDSFFLNIAPSSVLFNHKKWNIQSPKVITFAANYFDIQNFILSSDSQRIAINSRTKNVNNLFVDLYSVEANPINNLFHFTDFFVHGKINGNVHVKDVMESQDIDYSLNIDTLFIDQVKYGHLYLTGTANINNTIFSILPPSTLQSDWGTMDLAIQANYSKTIPSIKGQVAMNNVPMAFIYPFTKEHIDQPEGFITAKVQLQGNFYHPTYTGKVDMNKVKVRPILTGVTYYIDEQSAAIEQSALVFNDFEIRDGLYNKGKLNGTIKSEAWDNYLFNLSLNSDKLQVLSLGKYDNSFYYGDITAATTINLNGRWNNLKMNVMGKPLANSKLIIPISSGGDYTQYEYITFKKSNVEKTSQIVPDFNYNLRIDAIATTDLEAIIILDEATGDKLQAKGNGNLVLDIPSNGEMTLTGNYVIDEGSYNFAFKQLEVLNYKKEFKLEQGSVIKWTGDLYNADLAVSANTQVKARLYDLIASESDRLGLNTQEITDAQLPQFVNIHLNMNGALSKPQLTFKLDIVENRSIGTYAYQKLQRINTNERELLNQVSGLLLLNQFLPPEGLNNSSISAGAITNMSELLSSTASSQISNFANKLLGVEDLIINLKYKNYALSGMDPTNPTAYLNRNEAGLNVRKNFFNDRLVTEVGGIYDWGNRNTNYNLAGEFRVQYLLTKDGRIRLNAFSTSNYDAIVQQNISRQGGGLLFKKSFSNFSELFHWSKSATKTTTDSNLILPAPYPTNIDTTNN